VIARQGADQQARQIGADQPVQPIRRGDMPVVEGRAVSYQEHRASGDDPVMSCGAHATSIAAPRS